VGLASSVTLHITFTLSSH